MTTTEARAIFNSIILTHRAAGNLDEAARMELAREYFTDQKFRKAFHDFMWQQAQ